MTISLPELLKYRAVEIANHSDQPVLRPQIESMSERHPSETIFMSVKNEGRFDSVLGRFAPSGLWGKSRGDPANWAVRSSLFDHVFQARTWEHVEDASLFYNLSVPLPGGGSVDKVALTSETTLGDVRGKIVLLRRFEGGSDVGFDLTYWPENQRFRSATPPFYDVEDRYQNPGDDDKYDFIVTHLEEARRGDPQDLYITFSGAVGLTARTYSKTINPRINDYLVGSPPGRVGIIVTDCCDEPPDLVSNVINTNVRSGLTNGPAGGHRSHDRHSGG